GRICDRQDPGVVARHVAAAVCVPGGSAHGGMYGSRAADRESGPVNASSLAAVIQERRIVISPWSSVAWRAARSTAPVAVALLLWALSFRSIDLYRISDFGLLPALPWTFYAALAVLTV